MCLYPHIYIKWILWVIWHHYSKHLITHNSIQIKGQQAKQESKKYFLKKGDNDKRIKESKSKHEHKVAWWLKYPSQC